jgi:Domain of unknown function (DUF6429)
VEFDNQKIDEAALALLQLTLHDGNRVWKSIDWDVMDRLHQRGLISPPASQAKSVVLTEEGLRLSEQLARKLFAKGALRG